MSDDEFIRPFPALTPAQRYHLEVARRINLALWLGPDPRHRPDSLRPRGRQQQRLHSADVPSLKPSAKFIAQTPDPLKPLIAVSDKWCWQQRTAS